MGESGSRYLKIEISPETGEFVQITDENGEPGTPIDCDELEKMFKSSGGMKHVSTILYAHWRPG